MTGDIRDAQAGHVVTTYSESGRGEPLVPIHGAESDRTQFDRLRRLLDPSIRAIAYDQRDSGGTTVRADPPYTIDDLADDLAGFIDVLGIAPVHLLGTSFGGVIALRTALAHPKHVAGLIIVASTPAWHQSRAHRISLGGLSPQQRTELMLQVLLTPAGMSNPGLRNLGMAALSDRTPKQRARRHADVDQHDVIARLPEITAATMILHGVDDPLMPLAGAELMAERIPNATLVALPGRHGIATEFPDRVAEIVCEFLRREKTTA